MNSSENTGGILMMGVLGIAVFGILMSIFSEAFNPSGASATVAPINTKQPTAAKIQALQVTAQPTTAPPPQEPREPLPQVEPAALVLFDEIAPAADSPEITSEAMNACFSMYTRNKNTTENTCKAEWYPADFAPHSYDEFWCASNGVNVEWIPVRLFDGRNSETVVPMGGCGQ
jgi:hypothetical protein